MDHEDKTLEQDSGAALHPLSGESDGVFMMPDFGGEFSDTKLLTHPDDFDHVSRYVTGLIISPNKTLQGIYDLQVWDRKKPSRRAMHGAVFEAGWGSDALIQRHRAVVEKSSVWTGHLLIMTVVHRYMQQRKAMTM